jgi:hypothetical protein
MRLRIESNGTDAGTRVYGIGPYGDVELEGLQSVRWVHTRDGHARPILIFNELPLRVLPNPAAPPIVLREEVMGELRTPRAEHTPKNEKPFEPPKPFSATPEAAEPAQRVA